MGKKNKKDGLDLTHEEQMRLMLQTTELASVYWKDPDEDVNTGSHPLEREVREHRKKKKKKKCSKKDRENGLQYLTVSGKNSDRTSVDKAIDRVDKSFRKEEKKQRDAGMMGTLLTYDGAMTKEENDEPTYQSEPFYEEMADRIAKAIYSTQEEYVEQDEPTSEMPINMFSDGMQSAVVVFHMGSRKILIYDFDGNVVNEFPVGLEVSAVSITGLINDLLDAVKEELFGNHLEEEPKYIKGPIQDPVTTIPTENITAETDDDPAEDNEDELDTSYTYPKDDRLTQRLQIPDSIKNQILENNGVSETTTDSGIRKLSGSNNSPMMIKPQLP